MEEFARLLHRSSSGFDSSRSHLCNFSLFPTSKLNGWALNLADGTISRGERENEGGGGGGWGGEGNKKKKLIRPSDLEIAVSAQTKFRCEILRRRRRVYSTWQYCVFFPFPRAPHHHHHPLLFFLHIINAWTCWTAPFAAKICKP